MTTPITSFNFHHIQTGLGIFIVSFLWGTTNYALKQVKQPPKNSGFFNTVVFTLTNVSFLVPFSINMMGSLLFYYLIGQRELSLISPIVNASTIVFTASTEAVLGKPPTRPIYFTLGVICIMLGVFCMNYASFSSL